MAVFPDMEIESKRQCDQIFCIDYLNSNFIRTKNLYFLLLIVLEGSAVFV